MALRSHTGSCSTSLVASYQTPSGINVVAHDTGIVFCSTVSGQPGSSLTDTAGNTWPSPSSAKVFDNTVSGVHYLIYAFLCADMIANAANKFTFAVSGGNAYLGVFPMIFSGRNNSSAQDGSAVATSDGSAVTSHPGPSITTTLAGDDLAAFFFDAASNANDTFTAGSGFTLADTQLGSASSYDPQGTQYAENQAVGSYSAAWTATNSLRGISVVAALAKAISNAQRRTSTSTGTRTGSRQAA